MFEAYKIGIRLTLLNGVTSGLMGIVGQFRGLDNQLTNVNRKLTDAERLLVGVKRRMIVGGVMMAGGAAGFALIDKTLGAGKEYAHQLALMNSAGMKHLEIIKATQAAWAASKAVPTSSTTENLAAIRDLRMVFGDTSHAIEFMPAVQKAQAILELYRHGERGSGKQDAYEMAKALEMKGAVKTPAQFLAEADMMTKALVGTGGKVSAADFLSAFKYARTATSDWNDTFAYTILPTLIQEMKTRGGSGGATGGPGSALMSAYAAVVGGTVPQKALQVWNKLGLLDPSKVIWNKVGSAKGIGPGGIMGSTEFQANPYAWAQQFLVPALQKAGYLTQEQQKQAIQYLFPNRTAGFVMSQFVTQAWKFQRDQRLIGQASGFSAYNKLLKSDPEMAAIALHKQWQNLLAILGYSIMPMVIKGMQLMIDTLRPLGRFFYEHQLAAKALMYSLAGLSTVLLLGGAGLTLWAGFSLLALAMKLTPIGGIPGLAKLGVGFEKVAGGLGMLTKAAGVFMAAYAGWEIGGWLNKKINAHLTAQNGGKPETLGGLYYDRLHHADGSFRPWGLFTTETPTEASKRLARERLMMGHAAPTVQPIAPLAGSWMRPLQQSAAPIQSVAPARNQTQTTINNKIVMPDGRVLAEIVTKQQAQDASRPFSGATGFDWGMGLPPVALGGGF